MTTRKRHIYFYEIVVLENGVPRPPQQVFSDVAQLRREASQQGCYQPLASERERYLKQVPCNTALFAGSYRIRDKEAIIKESLGQDTVDTPDPQKDEAFAQAAHLCLFQEGAKWFLAVEGNTPRAPYPSSIQDYINYLFANSFGRSKTDWEMRLYLLVERNPVARLRELERVTSITFKGPYSGSLDVDLPMFEQLDDEIRSMPSTTIEVTAKVYYTKHIAQSVVQRFLRLFNSNHLAYKKAQIGGKTSEGTTKLINLMTEKIKIKVEAETRLDNRKVIDTTDMILKIEAAFAQHKHAILDAEALTYD